MANQAFNPMYPTAPTTQPPINPAFQANYNYPQPAPAPAPVAVQIALPANPAPQPINTTTNIQLDTGGHVLPGRCSICRKGKLEDSASCCTWLMCCFLLPVGIIPGICAFCYCCRQTKCSSCGYVY